MTYSAPPTKSIGDTLAAADWNTYVRDNMIYFAAGLFPTAVVQTAGFFSTTSTSAVDITGAFVNITTNRQSTILLLASGYIRADYTSAITGLNGVIGTTADTNGVSRQCFNSSYDPALVPFGYVFWNAGVAAGTITVKLQLKTSTASGTAYAGKINLIAIGIPEA